MHQHDEHTQANGLPSSRSALREELVHHLPFSVSAVAIGLTVAGLICFLAPAESAAPPEASHGVGVHHADGEHVHEDSAASADEDRGTDAAEAGEGHRHDNRFRDLFHLFHPLHMLFSAAATTAMFWRYERRVLKAVITGLIGAIGVCGLSDIVMPHVSLWLLDKDVAWHICLIENPAMVLTFAVVGVIVGLSASAGVVRSTFFSHSLHVFSSTMASIFYLIGPFERLAWIDSVGVVFLFIIFAVMVPCCLSDIVFPLFLAGRGRARHRDENVGCCG